MGRSLGKLPSAGRHLGRLPEVEATPHPPDVPDAPPEPTILDRYNTGTKYGMALGPIGAIVGGVGNALAGPGEDSETARRFALKGLAQSADDKLRGLAGAYGDHLQQVGDVTAKNVSPTALAAVRALTGDKGFIPGLLDTAKTAAAEHDAGKPWIDVLSGTPVGGQSFGATYEAARDEAEAESKRLRKAHPGVAALAQMGGGLASAALPGVGALGVAPKGAGLLRSALAAARGGAALGAANAAGEAHADDLGQYAKEIGKGTLIGGVAGGTLGAAGYGAGKLVKALAAGVVKPTEAAKTMQRAGVELTLGQMDPTSKVAQLEEMVGNTVPLLGPAIKKQRLDARDTWQHAVMGEGSAPGATMPLAKPSNLNDELAATYKGFEQAYAPIRGVPVRPVAPVGGKDMPLAEAFAAAADDGGVRATDETRKSVSRYLQNELSALPKEGQPLTADALQGLRSKLRKEASDALQAEDHAAAKLLKNAEEMVTDSLNAQLPEKARDALAAADAQYAKYKVVEQAVRSAKDAPDGFTPHQLSTAVAKATDPGGYARGAGGTLRELAAAGRETLDSRVPPTGASLLGGTVGTVLSPFVALSMLTKGGKSLMTGNTGWQRALQGAGSAIPAEAPAAARTAIVQALRGGPREVPASVPAPALVPSMAGAEGQREQRASAEPQPNPRTRALLAALRRSTAADYTRRARARGED